MNSSGVGGPQRPCTKPESHQDFPSFVKKQSSPLAGTQVLTAGGLEQDEG